MKKIKQELKDLIQPLTEKEFLQLEKNIIKDGCLDSLKLWNNILIDGHNRFKICNKHNIKFKTENLNFKNEIEAKLWILKNQLGRRNLSKEQLDYNIGLFYRLNKIKDKGNQYTKSAIDQNDLKQNTAKEVAKEYSISEPTVKRNEKFANGVDLIGKSNPEFKKEILTGKSNLKKTDIETIGKAKDDKIYTFKSEKDIIKKAKEIKQQKKLEKKIKLEKEIKQKAKKFIIKKNDNIKILEGDFFNKINEIDDNSIDLLNTDPPYFVLKNKWDTFKNKNDFLSFTEKWLKIVMKKIKKTGRAYISFAHDYQFDFYKILEKNNFFNMIFGNKIIWIKRNNNKLFNQKRYRLTYEPIFFMYGKEATKLNFDSETFGEMQTDAWEIATPQSNFKEGKNHPAQKPLELYKRIIMTGSKENDLILDCFAGSGTTGLICKQLNRKCILIEKEEKYIEMIKSRLV